MNNEIGEFLIKNGTDGFTISLTPDWPTIIVTGLIGIGSIFTSIAVAKISKNSQKAQNKAKKAELRQVWINELRSNIAEFIATCYIIKLRISSDKQYISSGDIYEQYQCLFRYRSKIRLMLDPEKTYTLVLNSLIDDVYSSVSKCDIDISELSAYLGAFQEQSSNLLEKAWCDIRKEFDD